MPLSLEEVFADVYGDPAAVQHVVAAEATRQGVNPQLALAVARQESQGNPQARSPKGALGVMQLMPGTAKDLGVDPTDTLQNIRGGVTYLKQMQEQFPDRVDHQLAAYNAGPQAVKDHGGVPPFPETQGYVKSIMGRLGPKQAEASQGAPSTPTVESLMQELYGIAPTPTPPPSAPPSGGGWVQEGIASLEETLRQAKATGNTALVRDTQAELKSYRQRQAQQRVGPPGASPVATGVAAPDVAPAQGAPVPDAPMEAGPLPPQQPGSRRIEMEITKPEAAAPGAAPQTPTPVPVYAAPPASGETALLSWMPGFEFMHVLPEAAQRKVAEAVPGLVAQAVGIAGPAVGAAAGGAVGMPLVGTALGGIAANKVNTALGATPPEANITIPKGVPLVGGVTLPITPSDAVSIAIPTATGALTKTAQAGMRRSQAGQAIVRAEEETAAAKTAWEAQEAAAEAVRGTNAQAYKDAAQKARMLQEEYRRAVAAREQTIAAQQGTYTDTVQAQHRAATEARALPPSKAPQTPSWVLYEDFGDAVKGVQAPMTPMKQATKDILASRGTFSTGEPLPVPGVLQKFVDAIETAGPDVDIQAIRTQMRALGPLTRSPNGAIRGMAKQLYGAYGDTLEQGLTQSTAGPVMATRGPALETLQSANATFRKEMALQDIAEWLRPGGTVLKSKGGVETFNGDALLNKFDKAMASDPFFAKSLGEDARALRSTMASLAKTPAMPKGPPRLPAEVPRPREHVAVTQAQVPDVGPAPVPVEPTLGPRPPFKILGRQNLSEAGGLGFLGTMLTNTGAGAAIAGTAAVGIPVAEQGAYLLSKALLTPSLRPVLQSAIRGGRIDPRVYGAIAAASRPEHRQSPKR